MSKPKIVTPHQLQLKFPRIPEWQQLPLIFSKPIEEPKPPAPFKLVLVFHGFVGGYERDGIFNLEDVFNFLGQEREFNGDVVQLISQRYFLFSQNHICVKCGLEGLYFAKERSAKRVKVQIPGTGRHEVKHQAVTGERSQWHLNMYALKVMPNGQIKEVLMTKDHILPASKGGLNIMQNYQTMCATCNERKGDKLLFS